VDLGRWALGNRCASVRGMMLRMLSSGANPTTTQTHFLTLRRQACRAAKSGAVPPGGMALHARRFTSVQRPKKNRSLARQGPLT